MSLWQEREEHVRLEIISKPPVSGERPTPLLFVHGAWHGAWCWDEYFLSYFAGQWYTVHALSLRGHGGSAGQQRLRWTRLSHYVADVARVAAALPTPPVVTGHSMGAMVVQKYLEQHVAPAGVVLAPPPPRGVLAPTLRLATASLGVGQGHLDAQPVPAGGYPRVDSGALLFSEYARDASRGVCAADAG